MARHNSAKRITIKYDTDKLSEVFDSGDCKFGRSKSEIVIWSCLSEDWVVLYSRYNSAEKLEKYWNSILAM